MLVRPAHLSIFLALSLVACSGRSGPRAGEEGGSCKGDATCDMGLRCRLGECVGEARRKQVLGESISDVDVLFVIDNSGSMREEQQSLAANFDRFVNVLSDAPGGLPSLHLGIVSSDMGAGPYGIMGCTGNGDNGLLLSQPSSSCPAPGPEPFIIDLASPSGSRTTNYAGSLTDVFSCISQLGTTGCGFEQHFESMRRALNGSNAQNNGFLRPDAILAVIMVADEDDCSTDDVEMFDSNPTLDHPDSLLGPLSSFRCFEFGVACDVDDPRAPGPRQDCGNRDDSAFMYSVNDYVRFLESLKAPGTPVVFSSIAGVGPVVVGTDNGEPVLEPGCVSESGEASPAVRIQAMSQQLGMPDPVSICSADLSAGLRLAAENIVAAMTRSCMLTPEPSECLVADVENFGEVDEKTVQELPSCSTKASGPCSTVVPNSAACGGSSVSSLAQVTVDRRGTSAPENTDVVVSCPR